MSAITKPRAAALALLLSLAALTGVVSAAQPAHAAGCYPDGRLSTYYDYAWITDHEDVCGYMAVKHYYVITGAGGGWTTWYGGSGRHYETPIIKQLQYGNWKG